MGFAREASPSSTGTQRVSLKDIADELGISQTAVSFAINHLLNIGQSMTGMSGNISPDPIMAGSSVTGLCRVHRHGGRFLPGAQGHEAEPAGGHPERIKD